MGLWALKTALTGLKRACSRLARHSSPPVLELKSLSAENGALLEPNVSGIAGTFAADAGLKGAAKPIPRS